VLGLSSAEAALLGALAWTPAELADPPVLEFFNRLHEG
jgi:hypothetical protein